VRADELQVRRARQAALGAEIHAAFASKTHRDLRSILQASAESQAEAVIAALSMSAIASYTCALSCFLC
jgi:hypothetical protein